MITKITKLVKLLSDHKNLNKRMLRKSKPETIMRW